MTFIGLSSGRGNFQSGFRRHIMVGHEPAVMRHMNTIDPRAKPAGD
jgi:hypothetical protein